MSIERDGKILEFQCDGKPRCGEAKSFESSLEFGEMVGFLKDDGWGIIPLADNNWLHLCPEHKQIRQNKLRQAAKGLFS